MNKIQSLLKKPVIFIIVTAIILTTVAFQLFVAADENIDDVNPELTLITLNSDAEQVVDKQPLYDPVSRFTQGAAAGGGYHIETNAYVPWMANDDVAFAYKKYNIKDSGDDYAEAVLKVERAPYAPGGGEAHAKAAIGLMFRSGLEVNDGHVFIQVRGKRMMAVFRTQTGDTTYVQESNEISYPLEMRLYKKGNTVKLSYRCQNEQNWSNFSYGVGLRATGPLYIGIAANSSSQSVFACGDFGGLTVKGIGTYVEGEKPAEEEPEQEYVEEDPPLLPDTLLRETFTDGSFNNTPASVTNPVWSKPKNNEIVNIDGNRKWFKNFNDYEDFVGNQTWTDYIVSVDLAFSEDCNPDELNAKNMVKLYARHMDIPMYGNRDYFVTIYAGYKMEIRKRSYEKNDYKTMGYLLASVNLREKFNDPDYTCLDKGKTHNLAFRVFDNVLTAYWDGVEVLSTVDTGVSDKSIADQIFGKGSVGICTIETSVYIDNLTVKKLTDDFGGDYDNEIEGNWNQPSPNYVKNWAY